MFSGSRSFLRTQSWVWLYWLLFSALFQGVGALAGLPPVYMLYAAGLTLFLLMLVQLVLFMRWRQRTHLLHRLQPNDPTSLSEFTSLSPHDPAGVALQRFAQAYQHAEAKREANEREREEYFSLWLHQIKTPLAAMSLLLDAEEPTQDSRTDLRRERQRTEHYVQMALAYLKLENPAADLDIRLVDVDDLLRRVIRRYKTLFLVSRTALVYTPTNLKATSDALWLEIVLEQLISNALKYAPSGTLRIGLHPQHPGTLVIADDGPGIHPEDLPRLFQKGFAGQVGRQRGGNSGLGLYLCRRICDRLGHQLKLESAPGQGTQVILNLTERSLNV